MADVEQNIPTNRRVSSELAAEIRRTRQGEAWESYDTVVIGAGASQRDPGWFDSWATFAGANDITWFRSRSSAVGQSYTNRPFDRWDYAFDIHMFGIEFIAPQMWQRFVVNPTDVYMPDKFTRELPEVMPFTLKIADTDELLTIPGSHAPAGVGPNGGIASTDADPFHGMPTNGQPLFVNRWKLGEPIMVPRGSTFVIRSRVDEPMRHCLSETTGPGLQQLPTGENATSGNPTSHFCELWYRIRITLVGVRYVMLRGGYAAGGNG